MYITDAFNNIPELCHLDENQFITDCSNVLRSSNQATAYAAYGRRTGLGGFMGAAIVRGTAQEQGDLRPLPPERRIRIERRLETKPQQRIVKHVRVAFWFADEDCAYATDFYFPVQFLGYGSYSLCHFDTSGTGIDTLRAIWAELMAHRVNFHRTFVFSSGKYEIGNQPTLPLLSWTPGTDKWKAAVNPLWLDNLQRMVQAAGARNIIVQLCLFPRQAIEGNYIPLPEPLVASDFGANPAAAVAAFCNPSPQNKWLELQYRVIDAIASKLMSNWNVVYEVGNELFSSAPSQLAQWVEMMALRIQQKTYGKLTTVSGDDGPNEPTLNQLPSIKFSSFHRGQWDPQVTAGRQTMAKACARAASYGDKHLVIDDDGKPLNRDSGEQVRLWALEAMSTSGMGPCSFNHKGRLNPMNPANYFANSEGDSRDELQGLKAAWDQLFQPLQPGVQIMVPRVIQQVAP